MTTQDKGMTEEEFLQKFAEVAPYFNWECSFEVLTGILKDQMDPPEVCPLGAVALILTGRFYDGGNYPLIAEAIRLPIGPADRIVSAADRHMDHDPLLRQRLFQIAGIK